jgi:signal transduction histidine kinase
LAEEFARRAAGAIDNAHLYDRAQRAIRARDEFLTVASHELNAPLASLQMLVDGFSEGPQSPLVGSPEAFAKSLGIMSRQVRRLASLVGQLLEVARMHAGSLPLSIEEVDLVAVAREVFRRLVDDLAKAGCKVTVTAPEQLAGRWDRLRLADVLAHLLSNAMKFGARRPIEIEIAALPQARARLVVQDHGIGIPPEQLSQVFEQFQRAVPAANYGGLGLGLYLVREIVNALGGTVQAESTPGVGSRFTVELPRG